MLGAQAGVTAPPAKHGKHAEVKVAVPTSRSRRDLRRTCYGNGACARSCGGGFKEAKLCSELNALRKEEQFDDQVSS